MSAEQTLAPKRITKPFFGYSLKENGPVYRDAYTYISWTIIPSRHYVTLTPWINCGVICPLTFSSISLCMQHRKRRERRDLGLLVFSFVCNFPQWYNPPSNVEGIIIYFWSGGSPLISKLSGIGWGFNLSIRALICTESDDAPIAIAYIFPSYLCWTTSKPRLA